MKVIQISDMGAPTEMADESIEYFRLRERAERAAAKKASSINARRAHQELAESYAALAQSRAAAAEDGRPMRSRLTIVT